MNWGKVAEQVGRNVLESKMEGEFLDANHKTIEPLIFEHLRATYFPFFQNHWATYKLPSYNEAKNAIFIYETRCHPQLDFLIYNATYYARGWGLLIYCTDDNEAYIKKILGPTASLAAEFRIIKNGGNEYKSARDAYNEFLKSGDFWGSVDKEYLLMMETDTYLRRPIPADFCSYAYIASAWPWKAGPGGGGLSIRRVASMKAIALLYPEATVSIWAQDEWAATGVIHLAMKYNNEYFVEADIRNVDPCGLHQWWTFISLQSFSSKVQIYNRYLSFEMV
jgi:hypothetical protein